MFMIMLCVASNTRGVAVTQSPSINYLRISPTDGLVNKTVFTIELKIDGQAEYVFIDFKNDDGWGYTEYFFVHPANIYTFERVFERVAVREYRIYAQSKDGKDVLLHNGTLRIKNDGNETGIFEIKNGQFDDKNYADTVYQAVEIDSNQVSQTVENDKDKIDKFSLNKVVPECVCLQQSVPVSFLVSCSGLENNDGSKYLGELLKGNDKVLEFELKIENQNTLSFCLEDIHLLKEGVYSLKVTTDKGIYRSMDSCITMVNQMNVCRFEMGNIVILADKIIDCIERPETKLASGNVRINGQIVSTSDLEINTRYKSVKGDGKLYINCIGYTSEDSYTPFTICDRGAFNISSATGEIKVEDSEKFAYIAGNKFDVKSYTITKDDGLNVDFKLFGFTDMLKVLIQDSESLKYLPKIKTFSVSANIKDNIFKIITDVEGKIPCVFKLTDIKFLKFFEFGDLKFKYDSKNDIFTSEAAVKIGNSRSKFLPAIPQLQLIGGIAIKDGKVGINKIAGKGAGLNAPIDGTGLFLNSLELSAVDMYVKPFTISLLSELSGGPKIKILSKNYSLITIYDAGIEMNITDLEASLVGKLKLLNFDSELASCKAGVSFKNGAVVEGNVNLAVINGKLYMWFKSKDDFGGKIWGYLTIPGNIPVIGGTTVSDAEFSIENSNKHGLYAYSNISLWKDVTFSAAYYFQTNELKVATNWFNNKAVSSAYIPKDKDLLVFASLGELPLWVLDNNYRELDVPSGLGKAIIKIAWTGDTADFGLILPDGTVIRPETAQSDSDKFFYLKNESRKEASYFLDSPVPGKYRIFAEQAGNDIQSAELYSINECPKIDYLRVNKQEGNKVTLKWCITDDDEQHSVSLYYDTDSDGYDGEFIAEVLSAKGQDGQIEWDVSDLIKNNYYVYAKMSDGVNAPAFAYCADSISVGGKDGLPAPQNLVAYSNGKGIHIIWDYAQNEDTLGYVVQVFKMDEPTSAIKDVICMSNESLLDVERGLTYLIRVRSMDDGKNVSNLYSEYEIYHSKDWRDRVSFDEFPKGIVNCPIVHIKGSNPEALLLCVKLNDNPMHEFRDKDFNVPVQLREGVNYISLMCINDGVEEDIYTGKIVLCLNVPYIAVNGIKEGHITFEDIIEIYGETDGQCIEINGKKVNLEKGKFYETLRLEKGNNVIQIIAVNSNELKSVKTFNVIKMDKQELVDKHYSDIEGHWAQDTIERMRAMNIMFDRDFKEFAPNSYVSRGEIASFIVNLLNIKNDYTIQPFKDVELTHPFREQIIKAYNNGLIKGYLGEYFPNDNITRQDLCVVLCNVLRYCNVICTELECLPFKDEQSISDYAKNSVNVVFEKGMVTGKPGLLFDPKVNVTRAETAVMLERLLSVIEQCPGL